MALGCAVAAGVAAGVVLARSLGPGGRGSFEVVRVLALLLGVPAGLGVGRAAVYLLPRREITPRGLFGAVTATLVSGSLVGLLAAIVLLATGWAGLSSAEALLLAGSLPLVAFCLQGLDALRGVGGEGWYRRIVATREGLFFVLLSAAFAIEASVTVGLVAWLTSWAVGSATIAWLLVRGVGLPRWPRGAVRRLLSVGAPQTLVLLLATAHLRLDVIVLRALRDTADVGQYAVAAGAAELIGHLGTAVGAALYPRTAAASVDDPAGGAARTAAVLRLLVPLVAGTAVIFALVGPSVVTVVYGSAFAPAGDPLRLLVIGTAWMAVFRILQQDLLGRGRTWSVSLSFGGIVAGNLALDLLLVPPLGINGAAIASAITYTLSALVLLRLFTRVTGVPYRACLVPSAEDVRAAIRALAPSSR